MLNPLDKSGFTFMMTTLWGKIKAIVPTKVSQLQNDSGYKTTDTIYGVVSKTANGLAPKLPNETTTTKYLRQDGTWQAPPNTTYSPATTSANGLMSSGDKSKLDGIATGANKTALTTSLAVTEEGVSALDGAVGKVLNNKIEEIKKESFSNPTGTIINFMGTIAPAGYLICDGSQYNISDYPYLTQHFSISFGKTNYFGGDGISTFKVPDLRGEFLRGTGTNSHSNQGNGSNVGEHQDATTHANVYSYKHPFLYFPSDTTKNGNVDSLVGASSTLAYLGGLIDSSASIYNMYSSRPTNTSILYCIKY